MHHYTTGIIRIKNLLLRTYVGINPEEKIKKQDVLINLTLRCDAVTRAEEGHIEQTLDYKRVVKNIIPFVEENRFELLEVMVRQVLDRVMTFDEVQWARVEIDKPHAIRFAESVSITLEAERAQNA
ncbi:dihydroneopterin aldolase [Sulfurivirga sp.]|uniref:FolB domain-containing protein n=1 Tax=Sulfurivirga sp. TaxID=2614236 RepID=UPI0025F1F2BB|nr:dihydroneopterin aldolase [Sulfurivirga sp.]